MATPLNPPNVRFPFTLPANMDPEVRKAVEFTFNGLTVHEQAFAAIKSQIDSAVAKVSVINNTSSGGGSTPGPPVITSLGVVNDQLGATSYTTQQGDNGAKIIVGDTLPVTVTLDAGVTIPWFCIIDNDSTSYASLVPSSGLLYGETSIPPNGFGIVYFDGTNFWCGATRIATDSTLGYVQPDNVTINVDSAGILHVPIATDSSLGIVFPDNVTIGIDSGMIYTKVFADSGAPGFSPATPGNPFYFDSSASPWHGYIWYGGNWNAFS